MTGKTYSSPPITEAVISLQFREVEPFDCSQTGRVAQLFASRFPTSSPIHLFELNVGVVPHDMSSQNRRETARSSEVGLRFASEANDRVLQIQRGSFTFSHLAPYTSWEPFRDEAETLWKLFLSNSPSEAVVVTRVATRFINKIAIPGEAIELDEYFCLYPKIPEGIPQDVTGMLLQVQMPQPDIGNAMAIVNLALAEPDAPNHLTVMLDIDLFTEVHSLPGDSSVLWDQLDKSRKRKNELFESFITDETRKLFK